MAGGSQKSRASGTAGLGLPCCCANIVYRPIAERCTGNVVKCAHVRIRCDMSIEETGEHTLPDGPDSALPSTHERVAQLFTDTLPAQARLTSV